MTRRSQPATHALCFVCDFFSLAVRSNPRPVVVSCQPLEMHSLHRVPDTLKPKTKMLYASSKQALRNALDGVHLDHQATDYDEISAEEFKAKTLGK